MLFCGKKCRFLRIHSQFITANKTFAAASDETRNLEMGRYILKRIGYMLVVLVILSFLMFLIYQMVPSNRAYTDAKTDIQGMKNTLSAEERESMLKGWNKAVKCAYGWAKE